MGTMLSTGAMVCSVKVDSTLNWRTGLPSAGAYTLLETRALDRVLPLCQERGAGIILATPYAGGWLVAPEQAGLANARTGAAPVAAAVHVWPDAAVAEKSRALEAICAAHGVPLAAAALQFPLAHPLVAAVIPGAKSGDEATQTAANLRVPIPPEVWQACKREGLLDVRAPTP